MSKPSVLVIGGSGFIGGRLVAAALAAGHPIAYTFAHHVLDLPAPAYPVDLTVADDAALIRCLAATSPQVVVYCAMPRPGTDPSAHAAISVHGIERVLVQLHRVAPRALVIYLSTDAVFGAGQGPYTEQQPPEPDLRQDGGRVYAQTRAAGEALTRQQWPNSLVVRTALVNGYDVYGRLNDRIAGLVDSLKAGQPIRRFADRYTTPTLVENLVGALLEVMQPDFAYLGLLHLAGAQRVTDYAFARCLARHLRVDEELVQPDSVADQAATRLLPRDTSLDVTFTQGLLRTRLLTIEEQVPFLCRYVTTNADPQISQIGSANL